MPSLGVRGPQNPFDFCSFFFSPLFSPVWTLQFAVSLSPPKKVSPSPEPSQTVFVTCSLFRGPRLVILRVHSWLSAWGLFLIPLFSGLLILCLYTLLALCSVIAPDELQCQRLEPGLNHMPGKPLPSPLSCLQPCPGYLKSHQPL